MESRSSITRTATWDDHIKALKDLFQRVREAGPTIRPTKCYVGYGEVEFSGHKVSWNGIAMDENKLLKIQDAAPSKTKTQVRSFLGLTGYYRKFMNNYAHVTAPLTDLVKKGHPNKVEWIEPQQKVFNELKQAFGNAHILKVLDLQRPFTVRSDVSNGGFGAMLLPEFEDGLFPIAYASRKLKKNEWNYCTIEKECLAMIFAVKRFQLYLYGTDFVIQTDHKHLVYIQSCKIESPRVMM